MSAGSDEVATEVHRVRAADGVDLALHRVRVSRPVGIALLVPGTFSNHTYWLGTRGRGFAHYLAERGYESWTLDPRGHGASQKPGPGDRWDFDRWARYDVPAAIVAARAEPAPGPLFLVGHSAGGAAILAALAARPALASETRGLVVAGTPVPWLEPWRGILARTIRAASGVLRRFPARRLGLGPEDELPGVIRQWMGWNIDGHWRGDDGVDYSVGLRELRLPVLAIAGAADHFFAPAHACRALLEMTGAEDRTFLIAGREHGFRLDYGHPDLLASRGAAEEVWPRVTAWMDRLRAG